ncbi:MAG: hypothetical protein ACO207_02975 [Bacilli bacterium]
MNKFIKKLIMHPGFILATWFVFVFFMVAILPAVSMATYEQGLTESIDTNFSFNPSLIYPIIASYGDSGRAYYLWQRWTFDLVWPMVYGLPLFSTLNIFFSGKTKIRNSVVFLPLVATLLDYVENIVFTILVSLYPIELPFLVIIGVSISALKWFALAISMLIVTLLPFIWFFQWIRKSTNKTS